MCSISGEINWRAGVTANDAMRSVMAHRGPDSCGTFYFDGGVLQHNRLAVVDPANGFQPMTRFYGGKRFTIVYNGEIYNCPELKQELALQGAEFQTDCDTEVVLQCYIIYREKCPEKLNGIFAFCIYDEQRKSVFFARDRLGVKPFFYAVRGDSFIFASELKSLLQHSLVDARIDQQGLWQLLFLAPAKIPGTGVFKDIQELLPGQCGTFSPDGLFLNMYWQLQAQPYSGTAAQASETVRELLTDAIERQLVSDVPLATLLSGGLDSTVVTAVASRRYKKLDRTLDTYSFEYEGNRENFHSTLFQPQGDDAFAVYAAKSLGTNHTVLTQPTEIVAQYLTDAVDARDMPGQADIDSSLVWFCRQIKQRHTVVLSGECADEIFGGYPWFYRSEMLYSNFFPWIHKPMLRAGLFDEDVAKPTQGYEYLSQVYRDSISSCPICPEDDDPMRTSRAATWLSVNYFMSALLERKDRMSMYSAVEVRVPFADHRILEFVYNVPWDIKFENGIEKALLRNAMADITPPKILTRKKSPYPKTHNPKYMSLVTDMLKSRLDRKGFLYSTLNRTSLEQLLSGENATWFGQLMGTPQLIAWLIQLDYWFEKYDVNFTS